MKPSRPSGFFEKPQEPDTTQKLSEARCVDIASCEMQLVVNAANADDDIFDVDLFQLVPADVERLSPEEVYSAFLNHTGVSKRCSAILEQSAAMESASKTVVELNSRLDASASRTHPPASTDSSTNLSQQLVLRLGRRCLDDYIAMARP